MATVGGIAVNVNPAYAAQGAQCPFAARSINTGGGACSLGSVSPSAEEQAILSKKTALVNEYAAVRAGNVSNAQYTSDLQAFLAQYGGPTRSVGAPPASRLITPDCVVNPDTGQCDFSAAVVRLSQQPQWNTYYCGPAAASEIVAVRGVNLSQGTLASTTYLHTDANGGTNFGDMAPGLNRATSSSFYVSVAGSGIGGGFTQPQYESDLTADIGIGWALAGNTVELKTDNIRLNGHPQDLTPSYIGGAIYHWIGIYGYGSNGDTTYYADSMANDASVFGSWVNPIPATSTYSSANMTILLNRRGFAW